MSNVSGAKVVGFIDPKRLGILPPFPPLAVMVARGVNQKLETVMAKMPPLPRPQP